MPSISGRAKMKAAGRCERAVAMNQAPHTPVSTPSLASRKRGEDAITEVRSPATIVVTIKIATLSACRRVTSV